MTATAALSGTSLRPQSTFLREMQGALASHMLPEMALTMKIGVMRAAGIPRPEIMRRLEHAGEDVSEVEVKMAIIRLERVVEGWHRNGQ